MKYVSTKTYRHLGPTVFRQWKANSHCNLLHGYGLSFYFEFECDELDDKNWVIDFGSLKGLKFQLEEWFDHTVLVADDDPEREYLLGLEERGLAKITKMKRTGCEAVADFLYEYVNTTFLPSYGASDRVWCCKVEVRETDANMAMRTGHRKDENVS